MIPVPFLDLDDDGDDFNDFPPNYHNTHTLNDIDSQICQNAGLRILSVIRSTENSTVYDAQSISDDLLWAVKVTDHKKQVQIEYDRRQDLPDSPYLVKSINLYMTPTKAILQMELCEEGDIQNLFLEENLIWILIHDISEALYHLHSNNWMHLDVSPGNILSTENNFKLADFGTLLKIGTFEEGREGAGPYCSPETLSFPYGPPVGAPTDIFSFGVVLFELASHQRAPRGGSEGYVKIRNETLKLGSPGYECNMSDELISLINQMLSQDPDKRPTTEAILMHPKVQNPC